jgi:uncharacterized membrane protein YfcA
LTEFAWVGALAITFVAATVQGVIGVGFAMVSVPILLLIDPSLAPVPQLLITLPLTAVMAWRERSHISFSGVGWVMGGRVAGALVGVVLLAAATQAILELTIALLVLSAVAIIASGVHVRRSSGTQFGAGLFSGTSSFVASIGGPPLALLYTRDEGPVVRSNLAAIFVVGILITIGTRIVSGNMTWNDVRVAALLFPALVAGYLTSLALKNRLPQGFIRVGILALSLLGATGLIVRVFVG